MKSYIEKLRDPRWQKKRLEILERDGWQCQECESTTKNLQVHHRYYRAKTEPWDYPTDALQTLCEDCHSAERNYDQAFQLLRLAMRDAGLSLEQLKALTAAYEVQALVRSMRHALTTNAVADVDQVLQALNAAQIRIEGSQVSMLWRRDKNGEAHKVRLEPRTTRTILETAAAISGKEVSLCLAVG